jgi:hypothetical protein
MGWWLVPVIWILAIVVIAPAIGWVFERMGR